MSCQKGSFTQVNFQVYQISDMHLNNVKRYMDECLYSVYGAHTIVYQDETKYLPVLD